MKTGLVAVPLALALAACVNQGKAPEVKAPPPYRFPHSTHVDAGVACAACHAPVTASTRLQANVVELKLPEKSEACSGCHDPMPKYVPVQRFEPVVNIDHAAHLKRPGTECVSCHVKRTEKGDVATPVPPMATCVRCHQHAQDFAVGRCTPCHRDLKRYPLKPVAAYTHEANFLEGHGQWARQSVSTCAACHDQTMCAKCHATATQPLPPSIQFPEKVTAAFIHRGDWISRHAMEQKADPASCLRCHGTAYCQSCHAYQGLPAGTQDPHPFGWRSSHGPIARSNIGSCAACHDQGANANCAICHSARNGGVNPHPPGWKGTTAQQASNRTCRVCH